MAERTDIDRGLVIRNVTLLVLFVALVVVGVVTVLVPELSDDTGAPGQDAGISQPDAGT